MTERPIAMVTGGSSGIGLMFADQLAKAGHDIVLVARRRDRLADAADTIRAEHGVCIEVIVADLGDPDELDLVEARLASDPPIDLFVNNAGFAARGSVGEMDRDDLTDMILVNVIAFGRLADAAMAGMKARGRGAIINVGSGTLFMQMPGNAGYGATKAFVAYFTRTMQAEAKDSGVQVQLLIPGVIATEFHAVAGNDLDNFAPERVMQADDLATASLRALELGEPVCIPSLPDIATWEDYIGAEAKLAPLVSRDHVAARYR